ncbi:MAG TPA: sulfotransferase [Solirubrobacterales bacterium]|nr:sulfotransferase [Solirubrobacterales bacterium]
MSADAETLGFLVIGAQKGGTTSLWQYLRGHQRIFMPSSKELPVFTAAELREEDLRAGMRALAAEASNGALLGTVTPDYMIGQGEVEVGTVARRIATMLPEVKLIALLRDPIERAVSSHTMAVRRGQEGDSVEAALCRELEPTALESARREPRPDNTYVTAGEYGRILAVYREHFPPDRLLVAFTEDLAHDPGGVLDDVLDFLGLPTGFRPDDLGVRHFRGGPGRLLDREGERSLREFFSREILPKMTGPAGQHQRTFDFFLETWNVVPEPPPPLSKALRRRLEEHFRSDAESLARLDVPAPWIARWDQGL